MLPMTMGPICLVPRSEGTLTDLTRLNKLASDVSGLAGVLLGWRLPQVPEGGEAARWIGYRARPGDGSPLGSMLDRTDNLLDECASSEDTFLPHAAQIVEATVRQMLSFRTRKYLPLGSLFNVFSTPAEHGLERLGLGDSFSHQLVRFLGIRTLGFVTQSLTPPLPKGWRPDFTPAQIGLGLAAGIELRKAAIEEGLAATLRAEGKTVPASYGTVEAAIAGLIPEHGFFTPKLAVTDGEIALVLGGALAAP